MTTPAVPRFSILTAVYQPPQAAFADTVASVLAQEFAHWEWILVDDASPDPRVASWLADAAARDPRIRVHARAVNGGIAAASQDALDRATGEFVALLDHDDVLAPDALAWMADALVDVPEADYLYSDQDLMRLDGETYGPFRKPDWSPERLRHHNYVTHFSVLRRSLVEEVGGFRAGYDGSQDHDLVLRVTERARAVVHVPRVLYHWREVPGSVADDPEAKPWAWDAGVRAVQDHLDRVGIAGRASRGRLPGRYRVEREPDLDTPTTIVIPTIGASGPVAGAERVMVVEAVRSVLGASAHRALEVLVVYDPPTPAAVLDELSGLGVTLVEFTEPFNFSAKCNVGALCASGERLIFLNDDVEAISAGPVEQLIAPLREPGVGATGPLLLFEDESVQHAGLVFGSGTVTHTHYRFDPERRRRHPDLAVNREVGALTGACLAVSREVFEEVGGFCEDLPVNYNDVDLSLKIRRTGRRLVWLHDVVLHHYESVSRSSQVHAWETELLCGRWGDYTQIDDPYRPTVRRREPMRLSPRRADPEA